MQVERREQHRVRVLVVDDHALSRNAVVSSFRVRGFECLAVGTVEEALASIETFAPDVVVLEWAFRDSRQRGRGLATRLRVRSVEVGRELAVIVLSHAEQPPGFRDQEDVAAYFTKPVAPHLLVSAIAESVGNR